MLSPRHSESLRSRERAQPTRRLWVAPADRGVRNEIEAVVESAPVTHVHVGAYLGERELRGANLWMIHDGVRVVGAIQRVRGISWAIDPEWASQSALIASIGSFIARWSGPQEIVFGPEDQVARILAELPSYGLGPAEIRQQSLLRCELVQSVGRIDPAMTLRTATTADLDWLLASHAAMCREDLGVDQVARYPEAYRLHFADLISRQLSFVGELNGVPVFKVECPVISREAWLFEGVYTEPQARSRGIATQAMTQLTHDVIQRGFLACLYVHRRNLGALRLYGRIGYREVTPWTTALISRDPPRLAGPMLW